ncbi:Tcp11-domain-containing protein [Rhizoclosmatium globosum]|uniref:Tcp11-domain-containing protein n=1 Tax=Rhizoclosmatium globosum TaxID=329046 RepID=A0A1Y2CUG5_9FUNG|nr:Tcp11-domain-containing protein [Rhizoclosmatium globosum]|eukprot:ORY50698.1 Tcp11-domain-containing protein [Rhizoclosmatium globosum]
MEEGDLDLMKAKMMAFDRLIRIVQSKQVIKGATTVINYLKSFSSLSPATVTVAWKNPARVFLSLYMIVAHTKEIMPSMGEDEEAVKKVATEFLTKFEAFITTTSTQNKHFSVPNVMDLLSTWILYYNKFETWKERDTLKIVDGLIAHYLELENLWLSVKDQIDADVQWKPRVEEQQHQIFGRLQKFGAKAMDRFTAARRELHAQFGITDDDELADGMNQMSVDEFGHSSGDESKIKQRGVAVPGIRIGRDTDRSSSPSPSPSPSTLFSTSPQKFPGRIQQRMAATDSVSKPNVVAPQTSYARRSTTPSQRSASSRAASPANVELPQKPEAETPRLSTAPSSERLTGFPASTPGFGDLLTNEKLAHELTLDPEFSLKKPELSELETQVRAMARKAFFEQVTQEFARGNYGTHVPEFLKDIKDQLMSMVSEKGKIAAEIQEALDMDFITHQIKNKTLNLPSIMQFIVSKMAQLCAPLRDAAIRNITSDLTDARSGTDFVPIFDQILLVLDDMKLDLANYRLQTLRPHLKTQAVEYEKSKFKESLAAARKQSGANNDVPIAALLPRTKAWLAQTTQAKIQTARERNPENIDLPENRVRYTDILHDALLGLVFSNTAVTPDTIAETLVMDGARVFAFQNEGQLIVIVSALLMLVQNIVSEGRGDKGFLNALKDRLVALLKAPEGLSVENLALEIISSCEALVIDKKRGMLRATGRDSSVVEGLDETRKGLIRNMVDKTLSTKDPVFGLLKRRVQACIKAHVVSGSFKREGLDKAGLDVVRTELEAFSYRVAIWVRYNGEVYGEWYDDILKDLI